MNSPAIKVFAPASVSNVACGYDVLGFALDEPGDEIIARLTDKIGVRITEIHGDQKKLPREAELNTAGKAAKGLLDHLGEKKGVEFRLYKRMPIGSGMGSSAASAVAAVVAVNKLLNNPLEKRDLLPFALEGEFIASGDYHADNVAPSLIGGFCLIRDSKSGDVHRLPVPPGLFAVVIYPHVEIKTKEARALLKDTVPLKDAVRQTANIAGLVTGLFRSDFDLIGRSLTDALIEPQRSGLLPGFTEAKEAALTHGALGCSFSGAGPSLFALCVNTLQTEQIAEAMQEVFRGKGIASDRYISAINQEGAVVL